MRHLHARFKPAPLALTIALTLGVPGIVHAQTAMERPVAIAIATQPLDTALNELAAVTGIPVAFSPDLVAGKTAPATNGDLTPREAVNRLLAGSGLVATQEGGSIVIQRKELEATLPAVKVTASDRADADGSAANAYRSKNASIGALGEKTLKDTPYSIAVYSKELIENKQARSLADITKADASVALMTDNLVAENNSLAIRGLGVDSYTGQKIDGLNARVRANDLPLEHLERVEILKGAGGFLYGFGAPGGIVNYVMKRPTDEPVRSLSTQIMDSGLPLIHGDLGGRVGDDGMFGYRVNLVHESGDSYIDDGESRRNSGSVALDWHVTSDLTWRVDALVGKHVRRGGYWGVVPNSDGAVNNWTTATPLDPIDGSKRLAPSFTRYGSRQETYGTDLTWQFLPDWKFSLAHRISESGREFGQPAIFADADGNYSLRFYNYANRFKSKQSQGLISGGLTTGQIAHELAVGVSHNVTRSYSTPFLAVNAANVGNLANPVEVANPFPSFASSDDADNEFDFMRRREIFASDTLHFGNDWDLIIGLRRGQLEVQDTAYDRSATTPTLASVFRPIQGLSLYGSYVEALEEGATAPETAANAYEIFAPLESKQYEIGAKAEGADWSASAALFRLQRGLTYTTSDNVFTQDGEARYQGLELGGNMRLSPQWLITVSAMWLDATNQKTDGGLLDGERIQGVAREQASVYSEYRIAGLPLTLMAGVRYVGKRPLGDFNEWDVDSATLMDVGARYETQWNNSAVTLRLNVDNLADEEFWVTQSGSNLLQQGAPRMVKLGAQIDF